MVLTEDEIPSLRCIQPCGLNLKWQFLFHIHGYSLWICFWTEQGCWHSELILQDESHPASRPVTKLPLTSEAQHCAQYRETSCLKSSASAICRYLHAWVRQKKQNVCLHVICHSVCGEDCICVLHTVQTSIFHRFWWTVFYFTPDKDLQYQAVIPGQIPLSCYKQVT